MNKKMLLAALLAVCLTLTLCACGGEPAGPADEPTTTAPTTTTTTAAPTTPTVPTPADGEVLYTVKVVDSTGAPVVGTYVQLCLESCVFKGTDTEGKAYFCLPEEDYKVTIIGDASATEYHFPEGSHELTLTYDVEGATESQDDNAQYNDVELDW